MNFCLIPLLASRMATVWIDIGLHFILVSSLVYLKEYKVPLSESTS